MISLSYKEILGFIAIALTFIGYWPYIRSIIKQKTRPHFYSWVIWSLATLVVFAAQVSANAGAGAWPIGVSGLISLYITYLAFKTCKADDIKPSDHYFLLAALSSLPAWYLTSDPLWAVLILTTVDLLGFGPTFRKAYHQPFAEELSLYSIMAVRNLLSIAALSQLNLTTVFFPLTTAIACSIFITMVWLRRKQCELNKNSADLSV